MTTATATAFVSTSLSLAEIKAQVQEHEFLTGLVSPTGQFFECPDYNHGRLMADLFGDSYTYRKHLAGWLHIGLAVGLYQVDKYGDIVHEPSELSWAQNKFLDAILECDGISNPLRNHIYAFLNDEDYDNYESYDD